VTFRLFGPASWLEQPVPALRIEIARILAPLAILGFMSARLAHADEWIGDAGFRVPDLDGDWRQPLYIPPLDSWEAWSVAGVMVIAGVACVLGYKTRWSALVFAATLAFVALSDRLAAYTVSKLSPAVMVAVSLGGAGTRFSVDAYLEARRTGERPADERPSGAVRFLQLLPVVMYSASGIAKVRGDWLKEPLVLWSHIHDSYQTAITYAIGSVLPAWAWTLLQRAVLAFEVFAPLWFGWSRTRTPALVFGVGMHVMIGLMFGPVRWLALLMISLLLSAYLPERLLRPLEALAMRVETRWIGGRR
jgi:uncharacterized membrane protein YphA (DoxX/SURF4 family)